MGHNGTLGKSPMGIAIICGPEGPGFFLHIFTKRARPKTKQKSHTDLEIEIDGVSCNGPGAREKFFDPIQAGQSAENKIEIALVSCTESGSREMQAKTK